MGRGAPNKKGLDYFPKMLNFYDDDKIFDLMDEYGPLGVTIYDVILTIVYSQGYYAELSEDKLSRMVIRKIGNKWIKNQKVVVQVVHYCAELGLIDKDLLLRNVITSEGIQKRYQKIALKLMKRQLYSNEYWLLKKEEKGGPVLNAPKKRITSEENRITSEFNPISSEISTTKGKETKDIYITAFQSEELEKAFQLYLTVRKHNYGSIVAEQIQALRDDLLNMSSDEKEQLAIVKKATAGGWKTFYKLGKKKENSGGPRTKEPVKKNMNNFERRSYDMNSLEEKLLESQKGEK